MMQKPILKLLQKHGSSKEAISAASAVCGGGGKESRLLVVVAHRRPCQRLACVTRIFPADTLNAPRRGGRGRDRSGSHRRRNEMVDRAMSAPPRQANHPDEVAAGRPLPTLQLRYDVVRDALVLSTGTRGVPVAEGEEVYFRYKEKTKCGSEAFRNTYGFVPQGFAPCHPDP